jgi:GAF domain-containing protein
MTADRIEMSPEILDALHGMSELLGDGETVDTMLDRILDITRRAVPQCDGAGLSLKKDGEFVTPVATDDWALGLDQAQYDAGEGPCLEAGNLSEIVQIEAMSAEIRWPPFVARARELELGSVLSIPLWKEAGALNLYSRRENAFGEPERALGQILSVQAGVAIKHAELYTAAVSLADGLRIALETRDLIGQAKGILMEREGIDDDAAFAMLKRISQHTNVKLRDVAKRLVDERAAERDSQQ